MCKPFRKLMTFLVLLVTAAPSIWAASPDRIPAKIVNNTVFSDDEIYVAIIGKQKVGGAVQDIYYDLRANNSGDACTRQLTPSLNTMHKQAGDWGYANIFCKLSEIKDKTVYISQTFANRMFFGFKSPMYLHVHETGGYAGADLQNPSDPNYDIRWDLMEFTYDEYKVMFVNTTRVDAFQYPMGVELWGGAGANNPYMKRGETVSYNEVINRWKAETNGSVFANCLQTNVTKDGVGPIIMQPSKVASVKNTGCFDDYINRIWSTFSGKTIRVKMGVLGTWTGRVNGSNFVLTCVEGERRGQTATVGRPTTVDVIEGAGEFARYHNSDADLPVQAMFCGAMNRGMINVNLGDGQEQDWGDTSKFFKIDTYNPYVKFFHQKDLSYAGYTYAFAYDDTFDQSATCATSNPERMTFTIGGFVNQPDNGDGTGGIDQGGSTSTTPGAAPEPSKDANLVKSLYSGKYNAFTNVNVASWGSATGISKENCGGNEAYKLANLTWSGIELNNNNDVNVSDMKYLHVDFFAPEGFTLKFGPVYHEGNGYNDTHMKEIGLGAGRWTSLDIPLSDFNGANFSRLFQLKLDNGNGKTLYIDNLYFWKEGQAALPKGKSGLSGIYKIKNRNSGKYLDLDANRTDNNTAIVQWDDEREDYSQFWRLTEDGNSGIYSIAAYNDQSKVLDVKNGSKNNSTQVLLYENGNRQNQRFVAVDKGSGYYLFVDCNSGKAVEIPSSRTGSGEWIKIWDINNTNTQQWGLEKWTCKDATAATIYQDIYYGGYSVNVGEGEFNTKRMAVYGIKNNDMSSLKVAKGYKITVYDGDNFTGNSKVYTSDCNWVGGDWNDKMSSFRIERYNSLTAAPNPTRDGNLVKSVYSGSYNSFTSHKIGSWGQSTTSEKQNIDGNEAYKFTNFNYLGIELNNNNDVNASDMKALHMDIYAPEAFSMNFGPVYHTGSGYDDRHLNRINLQAGWNSIDISLSDYNGADFGRLYQFKFDGGNGQTFYLDNLYFWKEQNVSTEKTFYFSTSQSTQGKLYGDGHVTYSWDGSNVKVKAHFDNVQNYAGGQLNLAYFWNETNGFSEAQMRATGNGEFEITLGGYHAGDVVKGRVKIVYPARSGDIGMAVTPQAQYTIPGYHAAPASVSEIGSDNGSVYVRGGSIVAPEGARIYDLQGRGVQLSDRMAPGIYVVVTGTTAVKVLVK